MKTNSAEVVKAGYGKPIPEVYRRSPIDLLNVNDAHEALGVDVPAYRVEYLSGRDPIEGLEKGRITRPDGSQVDDVNFVWLAMTRSRVLWPDFDPRLENPEPICSSRDGAIPDHGADLRSGPCSTCADAAWTEQPPLCTEVFTMLCWDLDEMCPFLFHVKRSGIPALRRLKSSLRLGALKYGHSGLPVNCCVRVRLSVRPVSNYYVPMFEIDGQLDQQDAKARADLAEELLPILTRKDTL